MTRDRYQPWRKGPAEIIQFPRVPVRCWLVLKTAPALWRAEIVGEPVEWEWVPVFGSRQQVLAWIDRYRPLIDRRGYRGGGLPIVIDDPEDWYGATRVTAGGVR